MSFPTLGRVASCVTLTREQQAVFTEDKDKGPSSKNRQLAQRSPINNTSVRLCGGFSEGCACECRSSATEPPASVRAGDRWTV